MVRPKMEHSLAILREVIGKNFTQQQLADLVGKNRVTIARVEIGKEKLSDSLAHKVSEKTGVSAAWLLENDLAKPIIDTKGNPYSEETFKRLQANRAAFEDWSYKIGEASGADVKEQLVEFLSGNFLHIVSLTQKTIRAKDFGYFRYQLEQHLSQVEIDVMTKGNIAGGGGNAFMKRAAATIDFKSLASAILDEANPPPKKKQSSRSKPQE